MPDTQITGRDPWSMELLHISVVDGVVAAVDRRHDDEADVPFLTSGLVDMQVNGFARHDVNAVRPNPDHIRAITAELRRRGVTTWVPTVITGTEDEITARIDAVTEAIAVDPDVAAAVPFVHVEGPFISDRDGPRGVHDRGKVRPVDAAEVARWARHGRIGYVTVSPHTPHAPGQIAAIVAQGIEVALGHTHASHDQLVAAIDAGATLSTHLGNGIASQLARHPNPIWTQLADERLQCGLIADGHHLPVETFTAMVRALGPGRAYVVSDAVELAGAAPGRYRTAVGGTVDLSRDGRLSDPDSGLLAGSGSSLADCLRWIMTRTGLSASLAFSLTSRAPGRLVRMLRDDGAFSTCGHVRIGSRAELCLVTAAGEVADVVAGTWRREADR